MTNRRLSMRHIIEVLRLKFDAKLSQGQIARSLNMSSGAVSNYLKRAAQAGLSWPLPASMTDQELEQLLFPSVPKHQQELVEPDYQAIHKELKRKGVTKRLLWEEYKAHHGDKGYQYSHYCKLFQRWLDRQSPSMRQIHKAGEKCFIDYCGQTVPIVDGRTGEIRHAQIFVAVLGASSYTYVEATWSQKLPDWISSHVNAFNYFKGVPELLVPDNLKSAIIKACRYEPTVNTSYQHLAEHYRTAIVPARPKKPKDKAKAEAAVLLVSRWILARLRHEKFFTLEELNKRIKALLEQLNTKPFKKLPGSRRSQYENIDRPALKRLPSTAYYYTEFKKVRVNIDYHIEFDRSYYSVPYHLCRKQVEVQATHEGIAIFFQSQQVARHPRSRSANHYSTQVDHMPERHRKHQEWTPERIQVWASNKGRHIGQLIQRLLQTKKHPQQAYRACLGIISLSKKFTSQRLDAACERALNANSPNYHSVKSILSKGLDQVPLTQPLQEACNDQLNDHENIRGSTYFEPTIRAD